MRYLPQLLASLALILCVSLAACDSEDKDEPLDLTGRYVSSVERSILYFVSPGEVCYERVDVNIIHGGQMLSGQGTSEVFADGNDSCPMFDPPLTRLDEPDVAPVTIKGTAILDDSGGADVTMQVTERGNTRGYRCIADSGRIFCHSLYGPIIDTRGEAFGADTGSLNLIR
jgi:hypothetical protein